MEPTALAHKYGQPRFGLHVKLNGTGKSGMTPLPMMNAPGLSPTARQFIGDMEDYQRARFRGFTARELEMLESMAALRRHANRPIANQLDNALFPLYHRDKWDTVDSIPKHIAPWQLGKGRKGYWLASNDLVWNALNPCLQLASLFITDCHIWPWIDALLAGEQREVDPSRRPPNFDPKIGLKTFHARSREIRNDEKEKQRVMELLLDLCSRIDLGFADGRVSALDGTPLANGVTQFGLTIASYIPRRTKIWLAYDAVDPLLPNELTDSERIVQQYWVAIILLHELGHALRIQLSYKDLAPMTEPYYEEETIAELGFSLEQSITGGHSIPLNDLVNTGWSGFPVMGFITTSWFREVNQCYSAEGGHSTTTVLLPHPLNFRYQDFWPVQIAHFQNLFQPDYWRAVVLSFGDGAGKRQGNPTALPKVWGERWYAGATTSDLAGTGGDFDDGSEIIIDGGMTDDQVTAARYENARRKRLRTLRRLMALNEEGRHQHMIALKPKNDNKVEDEMNTQRHALQLHQQRGPPLICDRFDNIVTFLVANRHRLALDSMYFTMPENTLLGHINRLGTLFHLTRGHFRIFLRVCMQRQILFSWENRGAGMVMRLDAGWPAAPPEPAAQPASKLPFLFNAFVRKSQGIKTGFPDWDIEVLRRMFNETQKAHRRAERDAFEEILEWCVFRKMEWVNGPEGVIRRIHVP